MSTTDSNRGAENHTPKVIVNIASVVGEAPLWHEDDQALYWIDIALGRLHRYDPCAGSNRRVYQHQEAIGGFTIQHDGSLLLFCARGSIVRWSPYESSVLLGEIPWERESCFNDVLADPEGRVFCGMVSPDEQSSRLYRLDLDGTLSLLYEDLVLVNGMDFNPDLDSLYITDSGTRTIYRAHYDRISGTIAQRSTLVAADPNAGLPDGMAVTSTGSIWSAHWDGSGLFGYDEQGKLIEQVRFPVRKVSSLTFGGPQYATAFVTTAGGDQRGNGEDSEAGSLFQVNLDARGRPPFRSRIERITS